MRKGTLALAMVSVLVMAATVTLAEPVTVQPKVPGCVVPEGNLVVLSAAGGEPQAVRVYFRSNAGREFYYVVSSKTPEGWVAKLPKVATPPTEEVFLYVESISKSKEPSRTQDFTVRVDKTCQEKAATATPVGGITVIGPAGTPVGFLPAGITTAVAGGGGILGMSTTTAIIVGTAVVGGATAGIVAATNNNESPK